MSYAKYKRALEIMTTLNENTVTIPMVREMAQRVLDEVRKINDAQFEKQTAEVIRKLTWHGRV